MIVINTRFLTQKTTGVQRYAIEICKRLPVSVKNREIVFVAPKTKLNKIEGLNIRVQQIGNSKGHLWEQLDLVRFLKKNNSPLLINFGGIGPIFYKNKITYLHDLAFKYYPETFSFTFQKMYNTFIPISTKNSKRVITVSNYVKQDIIRNYNISKVDVIYCSYSNIFKHLNLKREKIILAVSSLDPRKNFNRVIKAYKSLNTDYKLVFVGAKSKAFSKVIIDNNIDNKNIIFTGYLSDNELVELYNKASVFIYASLFEGFGIPPLEAQACGCPCIVSNSTSMPEICNNAVIYCNPQSIEDIMNKIKFLLSNAEKRAELTKKGFENIKKYSWDTSTQNLLDIIKQEI